MKRDFENPEEMKEMLAGPVSDGFAVTFVACSNAILRVCTAAMRVVGMMLLAEHKAPLVPTKTMPLNGPRVVKLLCDVHAHEVFQDGVFNSDPHAGNVIAMDDGRLGLIGYGATATLTHAQRTALAQLLIAISDQDDSATVQACKGFGLRSKRGDPAYLLPYALMCFHRGMHPEDMRGVGVPQHQVWHMPVSL